MKRTFSISLGFSFSDEGQSLAVVLLCMCVLARLVSVEIADVASISMVTTLPAVNFILCFQWLLSWLLHKLRRLSVTNYSSENNLATGGL